MKVKFNKKKAIETAVLGGSGVAGALVSKGADGVLPEELKSIWAKLGIATGTILLAGSIQGTDTAANGSRGFLLGMSIEKVGSAISTALAPKVKDNPNTTSDKIINAIAKGMNSANESSQLLPFRLNPEDFNPVNGPGSTHRKRAFSAV